MSASRRHKVRPYGMKTQEVADLSGGTTLVEFYSMADSSTTVTDIPILIAGGCWASCQLHAGIRNVPIAWKLMKLLSSVEVVPWRNSTGWLIPPQPLQLFQFRLREVVGLDVSFTPV